jgi:hypothetical protein
VTTAVVDRATTTSPSETAPSHSTAETIPRPAVTSRDTPASSPSGLPSTRAHSNSSAQPPRPKPPSSASSLRAEARGLAEVQRALRDGQPNEALRLLEAQQRSFKAGVLDEEREAARVLALCEAGRVAEARKAADRFVVAHPNSPSAARVSTCGSTK